MVVGLGPAGATAARMAARAGLRVLAVDRKRRLGEPVQCAEFIPPPLLGLARAVGAVRQPISAMATSLPSGASRVSEFRGAVIDRAVFDRALARRAAESGVELWTGTTLRTLDAAGATARVYRWGQAREVRYRMLVAADGPRSAVAKALTLPPLATVRALQGCVRLCRPDDRTRVWLSDAFAGGYAWLFPKGAVANLGLGVDRRFVHHPGDTLRRLHRTLVDDGEVEPTLTMPTAGLIPCGGLRALLHQGNILFAGDAAGTAHPITGAGIEAAIATGELAGEAVADALRVGHTGALEAYAEELRERFDTAFGRALARRAELVRRWSQGRRLDDGAARRGWIAFDEYYAPF